MIDHVMASFLVSRLPVIHFGNGKIIKVPELAASYGTKVLIITGGRSFTDTPRWPLLQETFKQHSLSWCHATIECEPSPQNVDTYVDAFLNSKIDVVVGIGGGSVLDAAKAIAGLLPYGNSVVDHLEGVGKARPYHGPSIPFIAVPTTAGTGSEATKNAVLSVVGEEGYKKSFRDEALVPSHAVVDPALLDTCSPELIAANGMDAFTQLLESYVSSKANSFTDALALSGITAVNNGLLNAWRGTGKDGEHGRAAMAYAAMISGITLAQVGLGSVHGLASPLGAFFPVAHGVVCGSLLASATEVNIDAMRHREPENKALKKYAIVGRLLSSRTDLDNKQAIAQLVEQLETWSMTLCMPSLHELGIRKKDVDKIISNSRGNSMKTNPIVLTDNEIESILKL